MKIYINKINTLTLCILVLISNGFTQSPPNNQITSPTPQTVTDYYLAIPNTGLLEDQCNFFLQNRTRANINPLDFRKSLIKTEDIQNGYLRLEPPNAENDDGGEVSLFKKKDGSYLLGIADWHGNLACKSIAFLELKNGKWRNVTKRYEKKIIKQHRQREDKEPKIICGGGYSFGQEAKSLNVTCYKQEVSEILELGYLWNGKDFILQK